MKKTEKKKTLSLTHKVTDIYIDGQSYELLEGDYNRGAAGDLTLRTGKNENQLDFLASEINKDFAIAAETPDFGMHGTFTLHAYHPREGAAEERAIFFPASEVLEYSPVNVKNASTPGNVETVTHTFGAVTTGEYTLKSVQARFVELVNADAGDRNWGYVELYAEAGTSEADRVKATRIKHFADTFKTFYGKDHVFQLSADGKERYWRTYEMDAVLESSDVDINGGVVLSFRVLEYTVRRNSNEAPQAHMVLSYEDLDILTAALFLRMQSDDRFEAGGVAEVLALRKRIEAERKKLY